ncbi:hypothetical protein RAS2_30800 [Phycisphaerae bacterium RAS2]|nr:hypothetical protein RAS2_30800 [Phycisphaerae bacterium RAS2]
MISCQWPVISGQRPLIGWHGGGFWRPSWSNVQPRRLVAGTDSLIRNATNGRQSGVMRFELLLPAARMAIVIRSVHWLLRRLARGRINRRGLSAGARSAAAVRLGRRRGRGIAIHRRTGARGHEVRQRGVEIARRAHAVWRRSVGSLRTALARRSITRRSAGADIASITGCRRVARRGSIPRWRTISIA